MSSLESSALHGGIRLEDNIELITRRHNRMRSFESAKSTQCRIVAAISVVYGYVVVSALVMGLDLEFVEDLQDHQQFGKNVFVFIYLIRRSFLAAN